MKATAESKLAEQRAQYEAWYDEQVRLGLEDIEAGRVVSDDDVRRHFEKRFQQHAGRQQKQAA
jgi:predicted transcriptional regulator